MAGRELTVVLLDALPEVLFDCEHLLSVWAITYVNRGSAFAGYRVQGAATEARPHLIIAPGVVSTVTQFKQAPLLF